MKQLNNSLYPAIFKRQSTRSYSDAPVSADILEKLQTFISEAPPLLMQEQAVFEIQPHKGTTMKIAAYAESNAASYMNIAFMLQQMDLFLQTNGLGAQWNATTGATKKQYQNLPYGICLVFGNAKGSPIRTDINQFDRKQPEEISDKPELPLVEAVRLAPSARNRQHWHLVCNKESVDFYCKQGNFIDNSLLKNLHWFDIGIAVCHAVLALQHEGLSPVASIKSDMPERKGYVYSISLDY